MSNYFYVGLDLGQAQDFTALAVAERVLAVGPEGLPLPNEPPTYHVRELQRFDLGTSYPTIVASVASLVQMDPLRGHTILAVDETGVGRPVVDLFRRVRMGLQAFVPITITAGNKATIDGGSWHVPKRDLVSVTKVLQQSKRLKVAPGLLHAKTLVDELLAFQVKITETGRDTYGAWREGSHDDLLLAAALACWTAERMVPATRTARSTYAWGSGGEQRRDDGWPWRTTPAQPVRAERLGWGPPHR